MRKGLGTTDNEKKVTKGGPVRLPASTWNAVIDAVKTHKRTRWRQGPPGPLGASIAPSLTLWVKNTVSAFSDPFKIVRLGDALLTPEGDGQNLAESFAHEGVEPVAGGPIAILQEPVGLDEIGRATFSGLALCWVKMNDPGHQWANPVAGETGFLESVECGGQARIWWHGDPDEAGPADTELAVVNLIGAVACDGGASLAVTARLMDNTTQTLASAFSYLDVVDGGGNVSIDLGPGTYLITGTVCGRASATGVSLTDFSYILTRLWNDTDSVTVPGSFLVLLDWAVATTTGNSIVGGSASFTTTYTVASGTKTLKLQARTDETASGVAMQILGEPAGDTATHIRAIRIA